MGTAGLQESGYFQGKLAQERLIKASPIPYTIVHSTQFMEFLGGIVHAAAGRDDIHLSSAYVQPIASSDVAAMMGDVASAPPRNGTIEIAGPERFLLNELVARYLKDVSDPRTVVADDEALYFGARLQSGSLVPKGDAQIGIITYDAWRLQAKAST